MPGHSIENFVEVSPQEFSGRPKSKHDAGLVMQKNKTVPLTSLGFLGVVIAVGFIVIVSALGLHAVTGMTTVNITLCSVTLTAAGRNPERGPHYCSDICSHLPLQQIQHS